MKGQIRILVVLVLAAPLLLANRCVLQDLTDITDRAQLPAARTTDADSLARCPTVRIGVISRFAPNLIYAGYQPVMDYLNREGTHHYELRISTSYQDAVDRLRRRDVEASFLGAWIYGHLGTDTDLVPIAAPLNAEGRSAFHAVLVTGPDSDLETLDQLRGRSVALPSDRSWSGNWLRTNALPQHGLTLADLDSVHHFDHHQTVVWQVLRGNFDAGVVKESVAAAFASEGLRAVARSADIPGPPLVAHREGPPAALAEIRRLLLTLDRDDPRDRSVLDSWTPEFSHGFVAVSRSQYLDAVWQEGVVQ